MMYFDSQGKALDLWDDSTGIPIAGAIIMILIDLILYGLLAAWLDNILPTEYGTRRPPFFCLDPNYWRGGSNKSDARCLKLHICILYRFFLNLYFTQGMKMMVDCHVQHL